MLNILSQILDQKRLEIAALDPLALRRAAEASPAPRNFLAAVTRRQNGSQLAPGLPPALIAELKRASPSKGLLAPDLDLFQVADLYIQNGAAAISVLTDEKFFQGKLETLRELRFTRCSPLPLLRKDFTIAESQIYEARANGADAILLIAAALTDDAHFAALHACALDLGLTALVEVHNEAEIERALRLKDVRLIGINNRNLVTFEISLETTARLRPMIPAEITVVAESGVFTAADVLCLQKANIDAFLVGEALVTTPNIAKKIRELANPDAP
jgi:indole-3-glycerol phosphate synthase